MGIGFVITFWFFIFAVLTAIYFFLRFLAKENKGFAELKKAFSALILIAFVSAVTLFVLTIGDVCLDYFYPGRIFTKNFGFEPTADVRIVEGSSFWTPFQYSTYLKFQANEETIQKIVINGYHERSKSYINSSESVEIKNILAQPQSRCFEKDGSAVERLVYEKQSQNAYFSLYTID